MISIFSTYSKTKWLRKFSYILSSTFIFDLCMRSLLCLKVHFVWNQILLKMWMLTSWRRKYFIMKVTQAHFYDLEIYFLSNMSSFFSSLIISQLYMDDNSEAIKSLMIKIKPKIYLKIQLLLFFKFNFTILFLRKLNIMKPWLIFLWSTFIKLSLLDYLFFILQKLFLSTLLFVKTHTAYTTVLRFH